MSLGVTVLRRKAEQLCGLDEVLHHAMRIYIHDADIAVRLDIALS
jgi:hypothetical protein